MVSNWAFAGTFTFTPLQRIQVGGQPSSVNITSALQVVSGTMGASCMGMLQVHLENHFRCAKRYTRTAEKPMNGQQAARRIQGHLAAHRPVR